MRKYTIFDHLNSKWYNNPSFPLFPLIRKLDGNSFQCYNCEIMILWLGIKIFTGNYSWGINKEYSSKYSLDTPVLRIAV